jgi:hypothetical protein
MGFPKRCPELGFKLLLILGIRSIDKAIWLYQ